MAEPKFMPYPMTARGDFYVVNGECLSCGVPHVVAPELVGWADSEMSHCYWKKQPDTEEELTHAFAIFDGQEAGCHRYAGNNLEIQKRIGADNCDYPLAGASWFARNEAASWRKSANLLSKKFWKRLSR